MNGQIQPGTQIPQQLKIGLDEKLKKFKTLTMFLMVIIAVLVVVLGLNMMRMRSVEACYADGYNRCVELCNDKINTCNLRCGTIIEEPPIMVQPPDLQPETPIEDNGSTIIQIIT